MSKNKIDEIREEAFKAGHAFAWCERLLQSANKNHRENNWKQLYEKWLIEIGVKRK